MRGASATGLRLPEPAQGGRTFGWFKAQLSWCSRGEESESWVLSLDIPVTFFTGRGAISGINDLNCLQCKAELVDGGLKCASCYSVAFCSEKCRAEESSCILAHPCELGCGCSKPAAMARVRVFVHKKCLANTSARTIPMPSPNLQACITSLINQEECELCKRG